MLSDKKSEDWAALLELVRYGDFPTEVDEAVAKILAALASVPSSTAIAPEGERKSLAGQAIEMAISALRDIQRRAPGTRTFFDYEAFIERELVPAMAMADKDRQGCIGLMGLLAKEKLKVEELSKPVSASASLSGWLMYTSGDGPWSKICRTEDEVRAFLCEAMYCPVEMADQTAIDAMMDHFRDLDEWAQWTLDWNFEDGGVHAVRLSLEQSDIEQPSLEKP